MASKPLIETERTGEFTLPESLRKQMDLLEQSGAPAFLRNYERLVSQSIDSDLELGIGF